MRQLLGDLFFSRLEVALAVGLPYLIVGFFLGVVGYSFIYLGRRLERFEWQRELEKGNRMGDIVRKKIGKRDVRIRQLTKRIAVDEAGIELAHEKQEEINGLLKQIHEVIEKRETGTARRRRA